jgi:hypothetical protein
MGCFCDRGFLQAYDLANELKELLLFHFPIELAQLRLRGGSLSPDQVGVLTDDPNLSHKILNVPRLKEEEHLYRPRYELASKAPLQF